MFGKVAKMGEKVEKLKFDFETGDASGIEDTFNQDFLI